MKDPKKDHNLTTTHVNERQEVEGSIELPRTPSCSIRMAFLLGHQSLEQLGKQQTPSRGKHVFWAHRPYAKGTCVLTVQAHK